MSTNAELLSHKTYSSKAAFVKGKCPRCHQGNLFTNRPYSFKFWKMYDDCPVCGFHFEIEPGFFWGCMYISYFLTVFVILFTAIPTYYILHDPSLFIYLSLIIAMLSILSPLTFRLSRLLMLYLFGEVKYDPRYGKKR